MLLLAALHYVGHLRHEELVLCLQVIQTLGHGVLQGLDLHPDRNKWSESSHDLQSKDLLTDVFFYYQTVMYIILRRNVQREQKCSGVFKHFRCVFCLLLLKIIGRREKKTCIESEKEREGRGERWGGETERETERDRD